MRRDEGESDLTEQMSVGAERSGVRRVFVLAFGVALLVVLGVLAYSWMGSPSAWSMGSGSAGGEATARQAYAVAAGAAAQWEEDARLASVSGQRLAIGAQAEEELEWGFQFFSPSTNRLALIAVEDGAARLVRDTLSPYSVPTFSPRQWRVDSDRAFQSWWDNGGASMVAQRADVDLVMQLGLPGGGGEHPVWNVTGLIAGTETAYGVVVDATDGALVAGP